MLKEYPFRFTLSDKTRVIVKKLLNNKYDFEMIMSNGNRTTFIWADTASYPVVNYTDEVKEAIKQFVLLMNG